VFNSTAMEQEMRLSPVFLDFPLARPVAVSADLRQMIFGFGCTAAVLV
jgi:hypothetical protein